MRKINFLLVLSFFAILTQLRAQNYIFNHGPYIQDLSTNGCAMIFTTSKKGFSWIELKDSKGVTTKHYDLIHGVRNSDVMFNSISIGGLKENTEYQYRLVSKEITKYVPSFTVFGDSITSQWYSFKTLPEKSSKCVFFAISDLHSKNQVFENLLKSCDYKSCDLFFYVGDMIGHVGDDNDPGSEPFGGFIDKSVEMFASNKPFYYIRGNHETRGNRATEFIKYFPSQEDKFYKTLVYGDTFFIMLDSGEDKPDNHKYYANMNDFDSYRESQTEWLKEVVNSKEYKGAKNHIVFIHFPPVSSTHGAKEVDAEHGINDVSNRWLKILNEAKADLVISGHTHSFAFIEPIPQVTNFPILVGSDFSGARVEIDNNVIKITSYNEKGEKILDKTL